MIDEGTEHAEMNTSAYIREEEVNEEDSHLLSWDEWLRRHVAHLLLFARQQSRSPEDAEDIPVSYTHLRERPFFGSGLWVGISPKRRGGSSGMRAGRTEREA